MIGEKITIKCFCGNIRIDYKSNCTRYQGKFCSQKCSNNNKKGKKIFRKRDSFLKGDKHPMWKGNNVKYAAIHMWIKSKLGKSNKCISNNCNEKSKRYVWANISGEYKRDLLDWHQLCQSCNMKDGVKIPINRFPEKIKRKGVSYNYL